MELFEAIVSRRSIRKFQDRRVEFPLIEQVLEAGRAAPSGGNMQPWEFILVSNPVLIQSITETTFLGFNKKGGRNQSWLAASPLMIVVCTDFKRTVARYGEPGRRIALMDTAAAVQNMLLAATAVGLASCWVSGFDPEPLVRLLELPLFCEPVALLPLGYPESVPSCPPKLRVTYILHYERYGGVKNEAPALPEGGE